MLLFYVDESRDPKPFPKDHPVWVPGDPSEFFVLSAVGIHDSSREPLALEIAAVKEKYFGSAARNPDWSLTELKGSFIAQTARAKGGARPGFVPAGYQAVADPAVMGHLLNELGQLFAKFRPTIFSVVVDKKALAAAGTDVDPLGAAYSRLYERVALTLEHVNTGEGALFVADQQPAHEAYFKSGAMHDVRRELKSKGKNRANFNLLLDKPLWVDTDYSTWDREIIQLADIVAYSTYEWFKRQEPPKERYLLWDKITPWFAAHWNTTKAQGGGIIVYPDPREYPPIG
ncbi:DUF3800 domain-containing protein [Demequina aurantiaca]|uniref:DUF3800 domain-containing protein n=1 Tax=Demequina aurantiaca TaxID=676200 RepID=UPI003D34D1E1